MRKRIRVCILSYILITCMLVSSVPTMGIAVSKDNEVFTEVTSESNNIKGNLEPKEPEELTELTKSTESNEPKEDVDLENLQEKTETISDEELEDFTPVVTLSEEQFIEETDNPDGTKTLEVYTVPIKCQDTELRFGELKSGELKSEEGQYAPIESDLVLSDDPNYTYETKNTPVTVQIADNLENDSAFRASYGNYTVGFTPINLKKKNKKTITQKELIKEERKTQKGKVKNVNKALKFNQTFDDDISIEVEPKAFGLKDNIILNKKPSQKEFSYEMSVYGAVPFLQEDGTVVVIDEENKKLVGTIEAPFMTDSSADPKVSYDIQVRLFHLSTNKYIYTIIPDRKFFENSKTTYPIYIDPDYTFKGNEVNQNGIKDGTGDTFTKQSDSTANNGKQYMLVGKDTTGIYRGYVKFLDVYKHIGYESTINSASLELYADTSKKPTNVTIATTAQSLGAYECTDSPLMENITGKSQPVAVGTATTTANPYPAGNGWYKWNIKALVQKWSNNSDTTRIVQIKHMSESTVNTLKCFHTKESTESTKIPRLVVNYTPSGTVTLNTNTWQKARGNANLSWENIAPTGISELQYNFGGNNAWATMKYSDGSNMKAATAYNLNILASTAMEGTNTIYVRAKLVNGQYFSSVPSNVTYKLDTVAPNSPASVRFIANSDSLTIDFDATTDPNPYNANSISGIARYEYASSTSGVTAPTSGYETIKNGDKIIPSVQRGYIWVRAVDHAGNHGPAKTSVQYELSSIKRFHGVPGVYSPTGNFSETSEELKVPTVLGEVSLSRTYNSMEYGTASIFGNGFTFNYAMKVIASTNKAVVIMPNSAQWQFDKNKANQYEASDNRGTLTVVGGEFRLQTLDMTEYGFHTNGILKYVKDSDGNQLNVKTDVSGKVTGITDKIGTNIGFDYIGNLLTKITDHKSGKAIQYAYTGNNLSKVSYPDGSEKHYAYTNGRLSSITESGTGKINPVKVVDLTYYTSGTYTNMIYTATDTIGVKTTYSYEFNNQTTTITDSYAGNASVRETRETYNGNLAITKIEDLKQNNQKIEEIVFEPDVADPEMPNSTIDQYGNITSYEYDDNGNLKKTTFPDESTEISEYNDDNQLKKFIDRNGLVTEHIYTDGLLMQTKCGGYITDTYTYYPETTYNIAGLVKTSTDQHNNTTTYEYDAKGNVKISKQRINDVDRITTNKYDTKNQLTDIIDPDGICTTYHYNSLGRILLTTVKDKNGLNVQLTRTVHDTSGRVVQEIKPIDFNETKSNLDTDEYYDKTVGARTEYNDKNQIKSRTDSMGYKTSYEYDSDGNLEKETLANSSYKTFKYDNQGRVTSESFYNHTTGTTTKIKDISYTVNKNETKTTDYLASGLTAVTTEEYNAEGKLIKKTNANRSTQIYTYSKGLLEKEKHDLNHWISYKYDTWGRVLTKTSSFDSSGESITTYTYDDYGNVKTESVKSNAAEQDETWTKKEFEYDTRDNQIKTIYYEGSSPMRYVQSYYSPDGKILREYKNLLKPITINGLDNVQNPNNQDYSVIKYEYDAMRRLASKTDALNQVETYDYDKENRMRYKKDRNGTEHTIEYDRNDNPLKKISGGITKTYNYDKMGNTLTKTEGSITTSYTYDGFSHCLTETTGNTVKNFNYNYAGMITNQKITIGGLQKQNITNTYDNMGNLSTVSENGTLKASYDYDSLGRLTKTTNANGITIENIYNLAGLVTFTINRKGTTILSEYDYTYTYDGKQQTKTDKLGKSTYTYDGCGSLKKTVLTSAKTEKGNTSLANAIPITDGMPTNVIIGEECQGRYFAFTPTMTGNYVIASTNCSGDPYGFIYASDGTQLAYNDDGNGSRNFKIEYQLKAGTRYIIKARMYPDFIGSYTVTITFLDNTSSSKIATISAGVPTSINIDTAYQMRYFRFKPLITGNYIIASTNASGDPYGYLYSQSGSQLVYNDDGNGNYNFKMEYHLMAGTEYIIGVKMYSSEIGSYTLTVTPPDNTIFERAMTIQVETSTSVTIGTANQMRYFRFKPSVTGDYIIVSSNNSGDPYGYLYSSNGTQLTYNDDTNGNRNFKIGYTLTAGTEYIIGAKMYSSGTGSYALTVIPPAMEVQEYNYDDNGNRKNQKETKNGVVTETTYTYDKNDRLKTEKKGNQTTVTYGYDANGNMTSKSDGTTQSFDVLDRMKSYVKSGTTTTYTYYPDDMRKSKKIGTAVTTEHIWNNDEIALDMNGTTVISSYIYGEKLITSTYGWYLYNAHGDVVSLTDGSGNITRNYDYDPFGNRKDTATGTDNNPYRYSGEYFDTESGYTYLRARYYDPAIGRFISEDPAFDGDNWYAYCDGDPINRTDPSGMWWKWVHEELTKHAFNQVKKKYSKKMKFTNALNKLQAGSVWPDNYKSGKAGWHGTDSNIAGGTTWGKVKSDQIKVAKSKWKSGNTKKMQAAFFELGKALHTIQDYYSHNIKVYGVNIQGVGVGTIGGYHIADRKEYGTENDRFTVSQGVIAKFNANYGDGRTKGKFKGNINDKTTHTITADNPWANYNNKAWTASGSKNGRYFKARDESVATVKAFMKWVKK